ncbi:GNAT family N-acetyltransferase [Paractinoplanes rhizophilus]|uniref:GNAT family N-acetyltransferase n=1 Tax=Paractinoplanes rhizophilus TaxID=1416877 RepID=A0ABW2HPS2_9ACTN
MTVEIKALVDPSGSPSWRRLAWVASGGDGRPQGTAFLRIPSDDGAADLQVHVHPAERRAGVGTRLLDAALAATAGPVLTEPVEEGSPGDHFCAARGLRLVLRLTYTRLALDAAPTRPGEPVPGYRLIHWVGDTPPELVETFVRAHHAMDDMPMDDAAYVPQPWDADHLRFVTKAVADRGEFLCVTAALTTEGEIAAFTELVVAADGGGDAQHYGTGVLPEHRGRGLARWMKAEQIGWVRSRFPAVTGLLADTADSNTAMRRVNESLGYRPTHRSLLYQHTPA